MRDRYERLYALPGLLYTSGSPVIIEAGALLKDNQYNSAVAQLKFKNISDSVIKAVSVKIFALDTAQRPLGEPVIFQYLDLSAKRDENFGQNVPVNLPDSGTRAFYVSVSEIVFENNEVWNGSEDVWQPLPTAVPLNDYFKDSEMTKQFKIRYGSDCSVCPVQIGDLWYCTCGKINHINEFTCYLCGKKANELFHVDLGSLAREKEERLRKEAWEKQLAEQKAAAEKAQKEAEENARRERIERERIEAERISKAKRKKVMIIVAFILFAIAAFFIIRMLIYSQKYNKAEALLQEKRFEEAASIFTELGTFRDSNLKTAEVYYQHGQELLQENQFNEARIVFNKSVDNDDVQGWIKQSYYEEGKYYLSLQEYDNAISALKKANGYEDVQELLQKAYYEKGKGLLESKDYDQAISSLQQAKSYSDAASLLQQAFYERGKGLLASKKYSQARSDFEKAGQYLDAADLFQQTYYEEGISLIENKKYSEARKIFSNIKKYKDVSTQMKRTYYEEGLDLFSRRLYAEAAKAFKEGDNYSDSQSYYYYCLLKPINLNDGSMHSLSDYYGYYEKIKTEKLRTEFQSLPQIQRIEAFNGTWSMHSQSARIADSSDRMECKNGICTSYIGKYIGNMYDICYKSGDYLMHNLEFGSLYKIISDFTNNSFRSDDWHLYTGKDTSYANEVSNYYR